MIKKIALIGNGKLSKSLQKLINDSYTVFIFDKDNIDQLKDTKVDLLIDCSLKDAFENIYQYLDKALVPAIICSTGHSEEQILKMKQLSRKIPLFKSENFSLGINLIKKFIKDNSKALSNYDSYLFDFHHQNKIDCPSGTSKSLIELFDNKLTCFSIRSKNIIGEHEIRLFSDDEEITIKHKATSSNLFSKGILLAIDFIQRCNPGFYEMEDLINEI